ncbi:MAG: histidine kinase dimerization/phospho-acceptor domain-containing protein [Elusimicrobiota bacterium]
MRTAIGEAAPAAEANALAYQEILFALVMTLVAVLNRENELVRYPEILWAFILMLAFNLSYHVFLRRRRDSVVVPLVSAAVNVALVSLVVAFSGGDLSRFWPLYLLPIFTACLYLESRHVVAVVLATSAFLGLFYLDAFWEFRRWEAYEYAIKIGVLAFSAGVTAHLSLRERRHRRDLEAGRAQIVALAKSLERRTTADLQAMKKESLDALIPGIAHNLNNPLSIILGTVDLLIADAPAGSVQREDLERIRAAASRCSEVTADLADYSRMPAKERP